MLEISSTFRPFMQIFRINTHKFDAIFVNKLAHPAFKIVYFLKLFIYSNPLFLWFAKTNGAKVRREEVLKNYVKSNQQEG